MTIDDYIPLIKRELQLSGQLVLDWIYELKLSGAFDSEFQIGIVVTDAINWSGE